MITLFDQPIENVEAQEFNNQFSWEIKEEPIFIQNQSIETHKAIVRNDTNEVLNICKSSYTPTSNEAFTNFVYKLSDITGFEIQNFDEFQKGKKVLAYLKAGETSLNGWKFDNYMAVGNAHDGSKALFVALTNHMIRCQNQFTALSQRALKAYHTANHHRQLDNIKNSISIYNDENKILQKNYTKLLSQKANEFRRENFIRHMFDIDSNIKNDEIIDNISTRKAYQIGDLIEAMEIEINDLGFNDFALFNGVTRWTTHTRNQKDKVFGNIFGSNALLNEKALNFLLN